MRLPITFALLSVTLAAVYQECILFEQPIEGVQKPDLRIRTGKETSLLVFRLRDTDVTNIPPEVTQNAVQQELNGFTICSQKQHSVGKCENMGEFIIDFKGHEEIKARTLNKLSNAGDESTYEIEAKGTVCVAAYQEGVPFVTGLKIKATHTYGLLSTPEYATLKALDLSSILTVLAFAVFCYVSNAHKLNVGELSMPQSFLPLFLLFGFFTTSKTVSLSLKNDGISMNGALFNVFFQLTHLATYLVGLYLLYEYSLNVSEFGAIDGLRSQKAKKYLAIYGICGLLEAFAELLPNFPIIVTLKVALGLAALISVVLFIVMIYKNFNDTISDSSDVYLAKKLDRTKYALLFTKATLLVLSFAGVFTFLLGDFQTMKVDPTESDLTTRIQVIMENNLATFGIRAYISNLSEFSEPVTMLLLMFIWRPEIAQPLHDIQLPSNDEDLEVGSENHQQVKA